MARRSSVPPSALQETLRGLPRILFATRGLWNHVRAVSAVRRLSFSASGINARRLDRPANHAGIYCEKSLTSPTACVTALRVVPPCAVPSCYAFVHVVLAAIGRVFHRGIHVWAWTSLYTDVGMRLCSFLHTCLLRWYMHIPMLCPFACPCTYPRMSPCHKSVLTGLYKCPFTCLASEHIFLPAPRDVLLSAQRSATGRKVPRQ